MNVLHLSKFSAPSYLGGMELFIHDLVEQSSKHCGCDILCSNTTNETEMEDRGRYKVIKAACMGTLASTPVSPALVYWLRRLSPNYDIIHLHLPNPTANLAFFLVKPRAKLVLHWHSDIIKQKTLLKLYLPLQRWLMERADKIIATTPNYITGSPFLSRFSAKCAAIPLGLDPSRLVSTDGAVEALRKRYGGRPIVFTLGRLIYYKGFEHLIESMKHVDASLIIGGEGPLRENLLRLISARGLQDRVFLAGKISNEDLGDYYRACDVFCLPSTHKSEAFGLVQVEAMFFGKPVVSTDIPGSGVSWVNLHEKTGLVVPPGDSLALAEALRTLLANPALRVEFGGNGKNRFESQFQIEAVNKRILNLYGELVPGIGQGGGA